MGRGKRNSSFFNLHSSLSLILSIALLFGASSAWAADWIDADGNTYTALKYIKGKATAQTTGGGWFVLPIKPNGTDIVKMRFKLATTEWTQFLWCNRAGSSSASYPKFGAYFSAAGNVQCQRNTGNTASNTNPGTGECSIEVNYNTLKFYVNGTEQSSSLVSGAFNPPAANTMLFASNIQVSKGSTANYIIADTIPASSVSNRGSYYLYDFQIYDSATNLTHNIVPVMRDAGSIMGLYDTVTRTFYTKAANSGDFDSEEWGTDRAGKKWTGLGGDNKMSNGDNWQGGVAPVAGEDLDFTIAVPNASIVADIDATFGKIYLGTGDLPAFSDELSATGINDLERMTAYDTAAEGFTFTLAAPSGQDLFWNGGDTANWNATDKSWLCNDAASAWYDYNNAIFDTADATATLTENVEADALVFNKNATVDGSATLTVPTVSVAADVSATISAPTVGALEKTGAGTLTLGSSRADATTLTEGTLAMSGGETTLDWSKFTLGTDPAKPVTLRFENGAMPKSGQWRLGRANITSTVVKAEGDWSRGGDTIVIGNAEGADTTFIHEDGSLTCSGYLVVGSGGAANSTLILSGGVITNSNTVTGSGKEPRTAIGYSSDGTLIVTNGASLAVTGQYLGISDANGVKGVVEIYDGSTIYVANAVIFGQEYQQGWGEGELNLHAGGTLSTKTIRCSTKSTPAEATAEVNFDGGTLKALSPMNIIQAHDHLTVNVSAKGGTIDNNGKDISIEECFNGPGTINLIGSGTTTFAAGVGAEGGISVANGTTLTINGTAQSSFGSLTLAAGSTLNIANYDGTTPVVATSATLPVEGSVNLTLNGGAFGKGIYAIFSAPGVEAADGGKFTFATTDNQTGTWSVVDGTLLLSVGDISGNFWTGRGGDGKMSTAANWLNGVPAAGEDIDLSFVSSATTIIADTDRVFGAVTMGTGVITFTNAMAATSFTDTAKIAVAADSTVTLDNDLVFSGSTETKYIVYTVAEGGVFRVTGRIVLTGFTGTGHLGGSVANICPGTIAAKGLFNDCLKDSANHPRFVLARNVSNYHGTWAIGSDGLDGTGGFQIYKASNNSATIVAEADFVDSANICNLGSLVIDAAGHEVALGTNTLAGSGGIYGGGNTTIVGGRVVANYDVDNLTGWPASLNNPFTVNSGATLALVTGADVGSGLVTVHEGSTLEVASGEHTFDGGLTLNDGATLSFNFTQRTVTPQIALPEGTLKVNGAVKVKIPADSKWPTSGEKILTTCGGFDAEGVTVSLAEGAPKWAKSVDVNEDGNVVLGVKPRGTRVIVR